MYRIERAPWWQVYRPWRWLLVLSSYGAAGGRAWTRRGAERAVLIVQGKWFAE